MPSQYDTTESQEQDREPALPSLAQHLERYLEPLLIWLDAYLDKRLVRTFVYAIAAILQFRGNQQALQCARIRGLSALFRKRTSKDEEASTAPEFKELGKSYFRGIYLEKCR